MNSTTPIPSRQQHQQDNRNTTKEENKFKTKDNMTQTNNPLLRQQRETGQQQERL